MAAAAAPPRLSHALKALQRLYPVELAAGWDNVGLLVGTLDPDPPLRGIFYCNDLVPRVLDEALASAANLIVTYHPTPFRSFKKVTSCDNVGRLVLRCAAAGVAVYSPHTACDSAVGGVNDWLVGGLGEGVVNPLTPSVLPDYATLGAGEGRQVVLNEEVTLRSLIQRVKQHLGLKHVRVALAFDRFARGATASDNLDLDSVVRTVAVCAGSGASVLGGVAADVWLTGEMSHHEVLAANAAGTTVILTDHSNTERGFLPTMAKSVTEDMRVLGAATPVHVISKVDADPLVVV